MAAKPNVFQQTMEATGGVVTPANVMDAAAFAVTAAGASELDSWEGIGKIAGAFSVDWLDGKVARLTGTVSPLGASLDAVGDKIKLSMIGYQAYKKDLVHPVVLGAVAAQNLANAAATAYDRTVHDEPRVKVTHEGRRTMFYNCLGLGLQIIGTELAKTHPDHGRKVKVAGAAAAAGGLAFYGWRATRDYWRAARS